MARTCGIVPDITIDSWRMCASCSRESDPRISVAGEKLLLLLSPNAPSVFREVDDPVRATGSRPLYYSDRLDRSIENWLDGTALRQTGSDLRDEIRHLANVRFDYMEDPPNRDHNQQQELHQSGARSVTQPKDSRGSLRN